MDIMFCINCGNKVYQDGGLTIVLCEECKEKGYYLKDTNPDGMYAHYGVYKHNEKTE